MFLSGVPLLGRAATVLNLPPPPPGVMGIPIMPPPPDGFFVSKKNKTIFNKFLVNLVTCVIKEETVSQHIRQNNVVSLHLQEHFFLVSFGQLRNKYCITNNALLKTGITQSI